MSLKRSNICILFSAIILLLQSCNDRADPLDEFEENKPGSIRAFYAYPSTIRMLGEIMGNQGSNFLKDVEKARLFLEWKSEEADSRELFISLKNSALQSEFEELLSLSSKGSDISVFVNDEHTPIYLVFSFGVELDYVLELKGEISMSTLRDIGTLDVNDALNVINLGKPADSKNPEIQENE